MPTVGVDRNLVEFAWGPILAEFYFDPKVWGFSYHGMPCCRFFLEAGPLVLVWFNYGD